MRLDHIRGMQTEEPTTWVEIELTERDWERAAALARANGLESGEAVSAVLYAAFRMLEMEESGAGRLLS